LKIFKKGATIAEMIVALAVVAVVSTVVLTFATLVHTRSIIASAKLEALQDMTSVEAICESWLSDMLKKDAVIDFTPDRYKFVNGDSESNAYYGIVATIGDEEYTIYWGSNALYAKFFGQSDTSVFVSDRISGIVFSSIKDPDDLILFVKVGYVLPMPTDTDRTYNVIKTFCVNPYVGDNI